ncbi:retrovirus-related Pol polyprotein from transposon TNT 1-94 [Trichonephila clavata]|uniref:Retrovirus-related Pol polyprotein from transposon TNT 1-94 n=1 Tax=Trichonephila clavata TaxID=2740835 RepID=A0A8X6KHH6_TRICU|nr:retrovirus-related Pol polyprotein from transposon TNT 1-94 [Trichonephila clavata]
MRLPSKSTDSTALIATRKKVFKKPERKCYACRKPGHLAKDCWKKGNKPKVEGDAFVSKNAGHMIREVLSDGGGEVIKSTVKSVLEKSGTSSRMSMPYTPQHNGAAERNTTIVESARSMIYATNLPLKLWAEAVNMYVYVLNRTGQHELKTKALMNCGFPKK